MRTRTERGEDKDRRETGRVRLCSLIQKCAARSDGLTRPPSLVVELLYCLHNMFFLKSGVCLGISVALLEVSDSEAEPNQQTCRGELGRQEFVFPSHGGKEQEAELLIPSQLHHGRSQHGMEYLQELLQLALDTVICWMYT